MPLKNDQGDEDNNSEASKSYSLIQILPIVMLAVVVGLSLLMLVKIPSKIYLLIPLWDFLQLNDLLLFCGARWSPWMESYLKTFRVSTLRWWSYKTAEDPLYYSPQQYYAYAESGDLGMLSNIGCSLTIFVIGIILVLVGIGLKKLVKKYFEHQLSEETSGEKKEQIKAK